MAVVKPFGARRLRLGEDDTIHHSGRGGGNIVVPARAALNIGRTTSRLCGAKPTGLTA